MMKQRSYNILGSVALVNFPSDFKIKEKKEFAKELLKKNKSIKTVLEKSNKFSGRLRKQTTKYLLGENTKETLYRENGCEFKFNIDEVYFSPRLSGERKEVCEFVKPTDKVLVMCAGIAPFPIVIAKNTKVKEIYSNELNKKANEYALINIKRNKVEEKVKLLPGDIKKVAVELEKNKEKFDLILMTRPNLKDTFLKQAFMLSKDKTRIYYHGFCRIEEKSKVIEEIKNAGEKHNFEINILNTKEIGDIAPGKIRYRVYFEVRKKNRFFNWLKKLFN